jgi:hypothetical protein
MTKDKMHFTLNIFRYYVKLLAEDFIEDFKYYFYLYLNEVKYYIHRAKVIIRKFKWTEKNFTKCFVGFLFVGWVLWDMIEYGISSGICRVFFMGIFAMCLGIIYFAILEQIISKKE